MSTSRAITGVFALTAGLLFAAWWLHSRPAPPIASSVNPSPVNAAGGSNRLVDERECANCHRQQAEDHQHSGHADTFRLSRGHDFARQLADRVIKDPERDYSYHYHHDDQTGLSVSIPEHLGDQRFPLTYALGSGQHAVTFLTLVPDPYGDALGVEHRISMYRSEGGWEFDLTPGHQGAIPAQPTEQLGKIVRGDTLSSCIRCHTSSMRIERDQLVDTLPNVGCQNCHGPGQQHVAAKRAETSGGTLATYSAAQEIELCGRCHRLPSAEPNPQLSPNILQNVRFQPANLIQSQCFKLSDDLKCSTCHDPHQHVSRNLDHYVQRCLSCHSGEKGKTCGVSPSEDCIRCHMPAIDVHRGIQFHDHWIRVR